MKHYTLQVRQAALDEAEEIRAWYEERSGGLGDRFLVALDACFEDLIKSPLLQLRREPFRYTSIKGFPSYRVVFAVDGEKITVYQIRHTSRIPHRTYGP